MSLCNPDVAVMQSLEYPLVPVIQACRTIARLIIWTAFRYESSYKSNKFSHWREAVKKSLSSLTGEVFCVPSPASGVMTRSCRIYLGLHFLYITHQPLTLTDPGVQNLSCEWTIQALQPFPRYICVSCPRDHLQQCLLSTCFLAHDVRWINIVIGLGSVSRCLSFF